jgi:two-component system LytT family response regulator
MTAAVERLRCFVVDDEAPARARLKRLLAEANVEVVGEAGDGLRALEQILDVRPDVVLLDIEMPELNGLGVASALPPDGPAVIFVTAYDAHALKAFEVSAIDYLVKPVHPERLHSALARVRRPHRFSPKEVATLAAQLGAGALRRMAVRCGARFVVFDPARASAVVSRDHYSAILVDGKELLADDSLDVLGAKLDPQRFLRIHRGAIVNLAFLKELVHEGDRRYQAVLTEPTGVRLPVSRERLPELRARLGL